MCQAGSPDGLYCFTSMVIDTISRVHPAIVFLQEEAEFERSVHRLDTLLYGCQVHM